MRLFFKNQLSNIIDLFTPFSIPRTTAHFKWPISRRENDNILATISYNWFQLFNHTITTPIPQWNKRLFWLVILRFGRTLWLFFHFWKVRKIFIAHSSGGARETKNDYKRRKLWKWSKCTFRFKSNRRPRNGKRFIFATLYLALSYGLEKQR